MFILFCNDNYGQEFNAVCETIEECIEQIEEDTEEPINLNRCRWFKAENINVNAKTEYIIS